MNWMHKIEQTETINKSLTAFLDKYGISGLEKALHHYSAIQTEYICKTKSTISRISIADIYYMEIRTHTITIHTHNAAYQKYGSLSDEQNQLAPYGFIKCNQSCLVSVEKIQSIGNNTITLTNGILLHMSQHYTPKVLTAFSRYNVSKK